LDRLAKQDAHESAVALDDGHSTEGIPGEDVAELDE